MRKLLSLFVAALFSVTLFADVTKVYCKVDQAWWLEKNDKGVAGAVAAHYWTEGEGAVSTEWPGVRMEAVEGETHIWSLDIDPAKAQKIIFVRVPAEGEIKDWGAKTKTQTFPADDETLFTITSETAVWGDPGCDGEWSKFVPSEPEPEPEYFLVGSVKGWDAVEANKFAATATEGEFKLAATLALDEEIKVMGIQGEDTTWYPAGLGNAFVVTEKYTGEHDIYFRPAGNDDWKTFHEGGFFWMGANPDPEPVYRTVYFKATQGYWNWLDAEKPSATAAYAWGEIGNNAVWPGVRMSKVAGEDFVWKIDLNEKLDSIIFVRVNPEGAFTESGLKTKNLEIPTDGNNLYTITLDEMDWEHFDWDAGIQEGEWSKYVAPKFFITGDSALVTDAGFPGHAWDSKAIKSEKDTFVLSLKANQEYMLKVIEDGDWFGGKVKGYDELTEKPAGLTPDASRNIHFQLAEAGDVQVIYIATVDTTIFKLVGNFYVEPEKPKVTLKLVPGEAKADGAKFAVWCWGPKQPGAWTEFFVGEGDTLTTQLEQDLDSVIFARFHAQATEPAWGKTGTDTIWNNTGHKGIDYEGLTFTITSMFDGQWEPYAPYVPEHADGFYLIGKVGGADWSEEIVDSRLFKLNEAAAPTVEYTLDVTLALNDEFKVVSVENDALKTWYPDGMGNNYVVDKEELAKEVTIYFRPNGDGGEDWHAGVIYVAPKGSTGVEETAVQGKAVKALRDGQLVIIKNGVRYNVIGIRF